MPTDLRLLLPGVALWLSEAATIWSWSSGHVVWTLVVAGICATGAVVYVVRHRIKWLLVVAMLACLCCGTGMAAMRIAPLESEPLASMSSQHAVVEMTGTLLAPLSLTGGGGGGGTAIPNLDTAGFASLAWSARINTAEVREASHRWSIDVPVQVYGFAKSSSIVNEFVPGEILRIKGTLASAEGRPGIAAILRARGDPVTVAQAPAWQSAAARIRSGLRDSAASLAPDSRGLLPGLVVGDESQLDPELDEAMRIAGLSHLTAVSGANLAIVSGAMLLLARAVKIGRRGSAAGAGAALVAYVAIVGPQPSVVRAAAMGMIALIAFAAARERSGLSVLMAAVCVLLVGDPWLSVSLGFALSVSATGALVLYSQRARARVESAKEPRWSKYVRLTVGAAAAASLATTPLIASLGKGIPLLTIPANALVAAAVMPATILGFVSAGLGPLSPQLGEFSAILAGYPTGMIAIVARWFSGASVATLPWPGGALGIVSALAFTSLFLWAWHRRTSWNWVLRDRRGRPAVVVSVVAIAVAVVWLPDLDGWPPPGWVMVACDVGQGDAVVLNVGDGSAVLVDAGPDNKAVDRCLSDLGVDHLALVVLTHFHVDHVGGLKGALSGRTTSRVVGTPLHEPREQVDAVVSLLADAGVKLEASQAGEVGRVAGLEYQLLWPREILTGSGSAPNNASVTALITTGGLRILLTGDLEPEAQEKLMAATAVGRVDVIKVPHHGSRNQSPRLVSWSGPAAVAMISVGRENRYGHPSLQTVEAWQRAGARITRSDVDGDVAIVGDSVSVAVRGPIDNGP